MVAWNSIAVICALCAAVAFAGPINSRQSSERKQLRFTNGGTFQIAIFEDLHYGEDEFQDWAIRHDKQTTGVMNNVLSAEAPQLVVLNGDLITGENTYYHNATDYIDQIVPPMVTRQIPWASTYGNHDSQYNLSSQALLEKENSYQLSLTQSMVSGDTAGVTNYYLPVMPSNGGSTPAMILWFFDSRSGGVYQKQNNAGRPDWVDSSVISWFESTRDSLNRQYGKVVPSLAFVHIPTFSIRDFQNRGGYNSRKTPGINDDIIGHEDNTDPWQGQDKPFMQALLNTQGLIATFSGHDHGDDWCFRWTTSLAGLQGNGLVQCFGRHTGYGGYGTWTRGSRQVLLSEQDVAKRVAKTWTRLEDKRMVGSVTLDQTYGTVDYSEVPNDSTGN